MWEGGREGVREGENLYTKWRKIESEGGRERTDTLSQ